MMLPRSKVSIAPYYKDNIDTDHMLVRLDVIKL